MEPISVERLFMKVKRWIGKDVFIHIEINPGGYFRNGKASLHNVHIKGTNPYRIFLELDQQEAVIHVDDVTHMKMEEELVIVTGYDPYDRLARTLEISSRPFPI
jgi:hypothetical protein